MREVSTFGGDFQGRWNCGITAVKHQSHCESRVLFPQWPAFFQKSSESLLKFSNLAFQLIFIFHVQTTLKGIRVPVEYAEFL